MISGKQAIVCVCVCVCTLKLANIHTSFNGVAGSESEIINNARKFIGS